jgi:hypothetical protein
LKKEELKELKYQEIHKITGGELYKRCNRCNEWFPCTEEYFYKNKSNGMDGLHPYCKSCSISKSKNWKIDNPEKYVAQIKHRDENLTPNRREAIKRESRKRRENGKYKKWQQENKYKLKEYNEKRQHKEHNINKTEWESCKNTLIIVVLIVVCLLNSIIILMLEKLS